VCSDQRDGRKILLYASKLAVVEVARATDAVGAEIELLSNNGDHRSFNHFLDRTLAVLSEHTSLPKTI